MSLFINQRSHKSPTNSNGSRAGSRQITEITVFIAKSMLLRWSWVPSKCQPPLGKNLTRHMHKQQRLAIGYRAPSFLLNASAPRLRSPLPRPNVDHQFFGPCLCGALSLAVAGKLSFNFGVGGGEHIWHGFVLSSFFSREL